MSCGPRDWVEPGKNACDLVRILGAELAAIIFQKQPLQPFVPEVPDHDPTVYSIYAVVNIPALPNVLATPCDT